LISAGIKHLGATETSIISSVGPISTIILSVLILGEVFNVYQVIGTVLVLCSVLYITLTKSKK
jgi:drug/metabolite transporter (DMT)-like permease